MLCGQCLSKEKLLRGSTEATRNVVDRRLDSKSLLPGLRCEFAFVDRSQVLRCTTDKPRNSAKLRLGNLFTMAELLLLPVRC